jgi:hypothetical protein
MPDEQPPSLTDEWRDADMHRVAGFLGKAYKARPW